MALPEVFVTAAVPALLVWVFLSCSSSATGTTLPGLRDALAVLRCRDTLLIQCSVLRAQNLSCVSGGGRKILPWSVFMVVLLLTQESVYKILLILLS